MPTSRTTSRTLRRLAEIQSLRTMGEQRRLAAAIALRRDARNAMEASERECRIALEDVARAFASDRLDPEQLSRLAAVARLCDRARVEAREKLARCVSREAAARRAWHIADRQRENLLDRQTELARKETRVRDDRASLALLESVAASGPAGRP